MKTIFTLLLSLTAATVLQMHATANPNAPISVDGEVHVATVHAEGVQIYECKTNASGSLVWQFREPVASLIENGATIGRHFTGPQWDLTDGSSAVAKVVSRNPGATPNDIPLLKLEVTKRSENGRLKDVTTILRIHTHGGIAGGPCSTPGSLLSAPYSADYAFYRKAQSH